VSVFTFDPVEHRYFLDGVRIPGVTTVLKEAGLVPNYGGFGQAQYRGLHVHTATEYLDLNDLDWTTVHPDYAGYVHAYDHFKRDTGFVPELIEYQTYNGFYKFAGTLDRRGTLDGALWQIDLKSGLSAPWHQLQTGGYFMLRDDWTGDLRGSLYLKENGTYELKEHDDPSDMPTFMAALALYHWKQNKGVKT